MGKVEARKKPCKRAEECCMYAPCQRSKLKKAGKKADITDFPLEIAVESGGAVVIAYPVKDKDKLSSKKKKKEKSKKDGKKKSQSKKKK